MAQTRGADHITCWGMKLSVVSLCEDVWIECHSSLGVGTCRKDAQSQHKKYHVLIQHTFKEARVAEHKLSQQKPCLPLMASCAAFKQICCQPEGDDARQSWSL